MELARCATAPPSPAAHGQSSPHLRFQPQPSAFRHRQKGRNTQSTLARSKSLITNAGAYARAERPVTSHSRRFRANRFLSHRKMQSDRANCFGHARYSKQNCVRNQAPARKCYSAPAVSAGRCAARARRTNYPDRASPAPSARSARLSRSNRAKIPAMNVYLPHAPVGISPGSQSLVSVWSTR